MTKNKFKVTNVWANTQLQRDMGLRVESMHYENQEIRYTVPDNMQIILIYRYDGSWVGYDLDYKQ
jgi:hypothetical protein